MLLLCLFRKYKLASKIHWKAGSPLYYNCLADAVPVSSDGDGKPVVLFPRILHARHLGVDREAISGFTVELLQEINTQTNKQTTMLGFHSWTATRLKRTKQITRCCAASNFSYSKTFYIINQLNVEFHSSFIELGNSSWENNHNSSPLTYFHGNWANSTCWWGLCVRIKNSGKHKKVDLELRICDT